MSGRFFSRRAAVWGAQTTRGAHRRGVRNIVLSLSVLLIISTGILSAGVPSAGAAVAECTPTGGFNTCRVYTFSGENQTFTVPVAVTSVQMSMWGGAGGSAELSGFSGGAGGYTTGTVAVVPGQVLNVTVGQGGPVNADFGDGRSFFGGGGGINAPASQFGSGAGGGLSGVWAGAPFTTDAALLIAGGGGGSAHQASGEAQHGTGGGGGVTGGSTQPRSGGGGSQTAGGTPGTGNSCAAPATAGAQFQGGNGSSAGLGATSDSGGGGGGGWFGGGGGTCRLGGDGPNGGGGGGSGYIGGAGVTDAQTTAGSDGISGGTALPAGTDDPHYQVGIGAVGPQNAAGGHGLVVIQFSIPDPVPPPTQGPTSPPSAAPAAPAPPPSAVRPPTPPVPAPAPAPPATSDAVPAPMVPPEPAPAKPAREKPLAMDLRFAAASITPGSADTMRGTLGPNATDAPVDVAFTGRMGQGMIYRAVSVLIDGKLTGECVVRTREFSCTFSLRPGEVAEIQVRVFADDLHAPDRAIQQLAVVSSNPEQDSAVTVSTPVALDRDTDDWASSFDLDLSSFPGAFVPLLALLLFALAASAAESERRRAASSPTPLTHPGAPS